eukprot:SAG22_NODE_1502_length_4279_cov_3.118900_2_plen_473_part_01
MILMPKIGGRLFAVAVMVAAVYFMLNFLFMESLPALPAEEGGGLLFGSAESRARWRVAERRVKGWKNEEERHLQERNAAMLPRPADALAARAAPAHASVLTSAGNAMPLDEPAAAAAAAAAGGGGGPPAAAAGEATAAVAAPSPPSSNPLPVPSPPPRPPPAPPVLTKRHESLLPGVKRQPLKQKPLILYRTRFMEPSGFSQESIDFVRGLSENFYVGIQMEGSRIEGYVKSWSPQLHAMIDRYHARESYISARPHTLIHHGAAGDFFCEDSEARPMYCVGRAMFETDRVPYSWIDNLATQHQIWVPSTFNVETFERSGLDPTRIFVVPEPMNLTLFDPDTTRPLKLSTGKRFHFLSVFAWNDRKGWDNLLKAYFQEFTKDDDVCLVLRTFPKHRNDANFDPEASGEWVSMKVRGAARAWFQKPLEELAKVHILATHLSERDLPRLYKAADAFVLPSRGEGWGRPITEAMAMA